MTMMMTPNCCIIMLDAQIESDTNKALGAGCLREDICSVLRSPQICSCIVGARAMGVRLV